MEKLLYVALDNDNLEENISLADRLSKVGGNYGFKINADHYTIGGLNYLSDIQAFRKPVFVDLKMNNGSRTMTNMMVTLAEHGVNHSNVWAQAERNLVAVNEAVKAVEGSNLQILGVTVTSRFDEEYCQKHYRRSLPETVRHFTTVSLDVGLDGVILPGTCLPAIADIETVKLVAGVRPVGSAKDSTQKQIITPRQALVDGANILVCGKPIHDAPDPAVALERFLIEMGGVSL